MKTLLVFFLVLVALFVGVNHSPLTISQADARPKSTFYCADWSPAIGYNSCYRSRSQCERKLKRLERMGAATLNRCQRIRA